MSSQSTAETVTLGLCSVRAKLSLSLHVRLHPPFPSLCTNKRNGPSQLARSISSRNLPENGNLFMWGDGYDGELGLGDRNKRNVPAQVAALSGRRVVAFACGGYHTRCRCTHTTTSLSLLFVYCNAHPQQPASSSLGATTALANLASAMRSSALIHHNKCTSSMAVASSPSTAVIDIAERFSVCAASFSFFAHAGGNHHTANASDWRAVHVGLQRLWPTRPWRHCTQNGATAGNGACWKVRHRCCPRQLPQHCSGSVTTPF